MKLSKGIQFFAGNTQTTYDLTNLNLSAGNYAITVVAEAEGFTDSDASNSVNYTVQAQLAAPTIAMNADGKTLEITDVENATSYDVYVDGTMKTNVAKTAQPVNFTLYKEEGYTGSSIPTYIKLDGAPANANDYDYIVKGDGSHEYGSEFLYDKAGNKILSPVTLSASYVYVWGFQVYVNGADTVLHNSHTTYDTALKITLSQNDNITLRCEYFYE